MGCSSSKHTALDGDDDDEGFLLERSGHKSAFGIPDSSLTPETSPFMSTIVESDDAFASFDSTFPSSFGNENTNDYNSNNGALPGLSGHNNALPSLSGHNNTLASPLSPRQADKTLVHGVSGNHNMLFGHPSAPSPKAGGNDANKPKGFGVAKNALVENPLVFRESSVMGFPSSDGNAADNQGVATNAGTANAHNFDWFGQGSQKDFQFGNENRKGPGDEEEDDTNDDEISLNMEDEQIEIVKTTEDGAQYLELSMEFLEVNMNDETIKERRNSMTSNTGSVLSTDTGDGTRQERRRGRRREGKVEAQAPDAAKGSATLSVDKNTTDTVKLENDEKSSGSKEKRKKKHRHHRHRSKSDDLRSSIKLDDLEKATAGGDKQSSSASKLNDSKSSMGSKKRSKKDKKKKKSRKNKDKEEAQNPPVQSSAQDLDDILNEAVEAELAVVGDMWMGAKKDEPNDQQRHETLVPVGNVMTNVRAVKLAVSMPGDYENGLLGHQEDEADLERCLFEILDIDPWDREGSNYSDAAAIAAMERDSSACAKKYVFDAFGNEIYPFSMLCAIGASLETVKQCYDKFPAAMDARDPTVGSPLHYACAYAGSADLVAWLIEKNPNQLNEVDVLQRSPFHVACLYSARIATLKVLVAKSVQGLELRDYESNTTLHVAAEHDAPVDVIELLAKKCPSALRAKRKDGATPLHLAVESGADVNKIKALVKADEEALKIPDNKGQRPIHLSLVGPIVDVKTVKFLAKAYSPGLKEMNNDGETPLAIAQRLNLEQNVKSLLET